MGELATAYKALLEEKLNSKSESRYAVYDYCTDFESFWFDVQSEKGSGNLPGVVIMADDSDEKTLIIVWDNIPQDDDDGHAKLLGPHLTPLDWALAFSTRVLKHGLNGVNPFSIHIIDLTSTQFEDSFALQMAASICEAMPWVKLYAPLPRGRRAYEAKFPIECLEKGSWPEMTSKLHSVPGGGKSMNRLDKLKQAWLAWVVQSNDHHDVNNIIGPDILGNTDDKRQGLPGAFLRRLAWSGHNLEQADEWEPWGTFGASTSLFGKPLSVFVVDDQLQQGWGRFVCRLLGNQKISNEIFETDKFAQLNSNQKIKIFGCLGSNPLITFLQNKAIFDCRDFHVQISQEQNPSPELILLDLRLYTKITEAQQQAQLLLEIIEKQIKYCGNKLAWPEIAKEELERIKSWCDGKASSAVETPDDALLLLPRLLALALPLTPIILFSATNQSRIREKLKPYQNIFTGFEKPRVLSSPDSITASICALHDGLDKAVMMMRLRLQLAHAQQAIKIAIEYKKNITQHLDTHHIELYVDETGILEEGITSGVAVCVYQNIDCAEQLQMAMLAEHESQGIVWAKTRDQSASSPKLYKGSENNKSNNWRAQIDILKPLLVKNALSDKEENLDLWSVVATRVEGIIPEKKEVSLDSFPDGPLDNALRFNIEFTLFVLIPFFVEESMQFGGSVNIFLATRQALLVPADKSESDNLYDYAEKLSKDFLGAVLEDRYKDRVDLAPKKDRQYIKFYPNIKDGWKKVRMQTFSESGGFPLVRGWLHEWQQEPSKMSKKIKMVKSTSLGLAENTGINVYEARQRRLFHDIADWACSAAKTPFARIEVERIFPRWFVGTDDQQFKEDSSNAFVLMRTLKMVLTDTSDNNSKTDALRMLLQNTYLTEINDRLLTNNNCAQQRLILWSLKNEFTSAHGRDLYALLADEVRQTPAIETGITEVQVSATKIDIIQPQVMETAENENIAAFKAISAELVKAADSYELSETQINERMPNKQVFSTNDINWGHTVKAMFFSAADSSNSIYSIKDKKIIALLKQEAIWAEPLTVFGRQLGKIYKGTNSIHVFAAKLLNKNWQIFPIEE